MASLLKEFKGRLDLIYIDPPFDVGARTFGKSTFTDENESEGLCEDSLAINHSLGQSTNKRPVRGRLPR